MAYYWSTYSHTHNMTQYCCTLFLHAEHGTASIYINSTHTLYDTVLLYLTFTSRTWHSIDLRYSHTHKMTQCCCTLLWHAECGIVSIYITSTHNMTEYCFTLLWQVEHGIVSIYITSTHTIWHSTAVCYFYMQNVAQYWSTLPAHTQYDTVLLYFTLTCRMWHSAYLHYLHRNNITQYCSALLVYTQYCTVLLCITFTCTIAWYGTVLHCITFTCTVWHSTALCYSQMHQQCSVLFAHATYYCLVQDYS